ncbi:D-alanine--D-alanine ligase family protein [Canibacter zhoujuaniae]|uniref:D-alanine--D-alanine ligase family protein n=1 Tax=Canibacter zhoujuaniae TaxID=2708343 RepID=UPI00141E5461|nr:D-alanine--D-alanine ligase family protein [Canibacter zhoujuaniae]
MSDKKLTVALLFGGRSSEHVVSCVTAAGVYRALDKERFNAIPVGITKTGQFVPVSESVLLSYALDSDPLPEVAAGDERIIWPLATDDHTLRVLDAQNQITELGTIDVVVPMLHGPFGEDGTVQGLCELAGLPYVGSGVLASALCMDKHALKVVLETAGVKVAPWNRISRQQLAQDPQAVTRLDQGLNYPLFVKPARAGSSVGVTRVTEPGGLAAAVDTALAEDHTALIESAITGREVEIGVLGGRGDASLRASDVIGEIKFTGRDFYDFESKYLGGAGVEIVLPAEVIDAEYQALRDAAFKAFDAAGCAVYARIDFFLTADGPVLNEINTLPGFTPFSMYPQLWEASGVSYSELITELIELALEAQR